MQSKLSRDLGISWHYSTVIDFFFLYWFAYTVRKQVRFDLGVWRLTTVWGLAIVVWWRNEREVSACTPCSNSPPCCPHSFKAILPHIPQGLSQQASHFPLFRSTFHLIGAIQQDGLLEHQYAFGFRLRQRQISSNKGCFLCYFTQIHTHTLSSSVIYFEIELCFQTHRDEVTTDCIESINNYIRVNT